VALEVQVELSGDADDEELDGARRALLAELEEADAGDARPAPGEEVPPGSKGFDFRALGELLVTLGETPDALKKLVGAVRDWLGRNREGYRVRIVLGGNELVVDRVSAETQQRLIDAFLSVCPGTAQQLEQLASQSAPVPPPISHPPVPEAEHG